MMIHFQNASEKEKIKKYHHQKNRFQRILKKKRKEKENQKHSYVSEFNYLSTDQHYPCILLVTYFVKQWGLENFHIIQFTYKHSEHLLFQELSDARTFCLQQL